jgi:hypothetical protein
LQASASVASVTSLVAALVAPRWIEVLFDASPDNGDGSLERWSTLSCMVVTAGVFSSLARLEWCRSAVQP